MEEEIYSSYDVPGPPEGHLLCSDDIDGEIMEDETDFQVDAETSECGSNTDVKEQYNESETVPVDPSIIARPPQIFTAENPYPSYYDPNTSNEPYQETGQYYSEGGADMPVGMETAATGDVASYSQLEKERKKKKKEKVKLG